MGHPGYSIYLCAIPSPNSTRASLGWIPFFEAVSRRQPPGRGPVQKLIVLESWVEVPIDATLTSPITRFHGLVKLTLSSLCFRVSGCAFRLTDDDVAEISVALPCLTEATFGHVCCVNSCRTTVSSLLSLSTHCKDLVALEIHFNTTNLLDDLTAISEVLQRRGVRSLQKCKLRWLNMWNAPVRIREEDRRSVAAGFLAIFPSLCRIITNADTGWNLFE